MKNRPEVEANNTKNCKNTKTDINKPVKTDITLTTALKEICKNKQDKIRQETKEPKHLEKQIQDLNIIEQGDHIIGRYHTKDTWKYYVGVVKVIDQIKNLYTISYYKTVKNKVDLYFVQKKKEDIDIVSLPTIVKKVYLVQVAQDPNKFVFNDEEDAIYF